MIEITIDLEFEIAKKLEKLAETKKCTPAEYIENYLIEYVKKHEKKTSE